jgi:thiol-disulfide isomerase/thioredoxin
VSTRAFFAAIAFAAAAAGGLLWWAMRPAPTSSAVSIAPSALWAATFRDAAGAPHSLGEIRATLLVVNFWATWCAPCREEMPALSRVQARWRDRGVAFIGLANDDAAKVERFGRDLGISYPLWVGGDAVTELSRRLGNGRGVLPHTAIIDGSGELLEGRVGPYTEAELDAKLAQLAVKRQ